MSISDRAPVDDRPGVAPAAERSTNVVTRIVYYFCLLAASLLAASIVADDLLPTLIAAFGAWALITLVIFPGRSAASLGMFVAVTAALLLRNYSELGPSARLWACANLVVLLSPFVTLPLRRVRGFPFLHIWCLVEAVYVYVSCMIGRPLALYVRTFTPEVREAGFRTLLLFTTVLVVTGTILTRAFGLRMTRAEARRTARTTAEITPAVIPRAYALLLGGSLLLVALSATGLGARLGSATEAIRSVAFAGGLMLTMLWLQHRLANWHKIVVLVAAGAVTLTGLGSGLLYQSAVPGILFLALLVGHRRRVPWAPLILAILVLIVLNVNKSAFRAQTWSGGQATEADAGSGVEFLQYSQDNLSTANQDRVSETANRFSNSDLLGYTATWVPNRYPYFGYQAYTSLPQLLIPRALLPDKGTFNQANEFGREYDLIARSDYITSVNTPLHVEAYVAGGPVFMVFVAGICGFVLAFFTYLLRSGNPAAELAGCALTVQVVLTVESGFLGFMLVIPFMAFIVPILWWAFRLSPEDRRRDRRTEQGSSRRGIGRRSTPATHSREAIMELRARARSSEPPLPRSPAT